MYPSRAKSLFGPSQFSVVKFHAQRLLARLNRTRSVLFSPRESSSCPCGDQAKFLVTAGPASVVSWNKRHRVKGRELALPFRRRVDDDLLAVDDERAGLPPFGVAASELDGGRCACVL